MSNQDKPVQTWQLPTLDDQQSQKAEKTNALNKKANWVYEPPEQEHEPEAQMPTAEEIEAIRQAAWEEGLKDGKAEGLKQGLEQGLQEGHKEGFEQGQQQGLDEGRQQGQSDVQQVSESLTKILDQLARPMAQVDHDVEQQLVSLAVALARAVVRVEPSINQEVLLSALQEALQVLPVNESSYVIRVNPDDLEVLQSHFSEQHIQQQHWQFVADSELARGGVDVVTDSNAVDLSIERRCRDILDKFLLDNGLNNE